MSERTLQGKFFISVSPFDPRTIEDVGEILRCFETYQQEELYLVQFFNRETGEEREQRIMPVSAMAYWRIYNSKEQMRVAHNEAREGVFS
jgi:hypothetical protein